MNVIVVGRSVERFFNGIQLKPSETKLETNILKNLTAAENYVVLYFYRIGLIKLSLKIVPKRG